MRGAVNVLEGFGRLRREMQSSVDNTQSTPEVQIVTPLDAFFSKHRYSKSLVPFSDLDASCRKDFDNRVGEYYVEKVGGTVTHLFVAQEVARQYGIVIASCDRHTVQQ